MHHAAHSYVFQCHFWLINRLLPKDNPCLVVRRPTAETDSMACVLRSSRPSSMKQTRTTARRRVFCAPSNACRGRRAHRSVSISRISVRTDTQRERRARARSSHSGFEIFIPTGDQSRVRLPTTGKQLASSFGSNQIIVDRTDASKSPTQPHRAMMFIETKNSKSIIKSLILVEQSNETNEHTGNVTVIFNHRVSTVICLSSSRAIESRECYHA